MSGASPVRPEHVALCCRSHAISGIAASMRRLSEACGFRLLVCGAGNTRADRPEHLRAVWAKDAPLGARIDAIDNVLRGSGVQVVVPNDLAEAYVAAAIDPDFRVLAWAHGDDDDAHDLYERTAPLAHGHLAVNDKLASQVAAYAAVAPASVSRLACGVPIPRFIAPVDRKTTAGVRVLFAGWLDRRNKRSHDLPGLCEALRKRGVRFELTIAGEGPAYGDLLAACAPHVRLADTAMLGRVDRRVMPALYLAHDVLVMTSRSEGCPVVAMEAMAAGRPVVVTDGCGGASGHVRASCEHGRGAGVVVPTGDADALAEALARLASDRESLAGMGVAAREFAEREFSIERVGARLLDTASDASRRDGLGAEPSEVARCIWDTAVLAGAGVGDDRADLSRRLRMAGLPDAPPACPRVRRRVRRFEAAIAQAKRASGVPTPRVVIYPEGAHTRGLGEAIRAAGCVCAIADDRYECTPGGAADGIPRRAPSGLASGSFDAVVVCSDEHEETLLPRARAWAKGKAVVGMYTDLSMAA